MTINSMTKSHVKMDKKFTKCDDQYLEISIEFRSITIIFV